MPLTNAVYVPHMLVMLYVSSFLRLVEAYCTATGVAEATLSSRLFNDGKRIAQIRAGSDVGVRRLDRAMAWFIKYWPGSANWPEDISKPLEIVE